MRTLPMFGLEVCTLGPSEVVEHCIALATAKRAEGQARRAALVVALNPEKVMRANANAALAAALQRADLLIPDGIGVCLAARLLHRTSMTRVCGSDLMPMLCAAAAESGASVYVYGARPETNEMACQRLLERHPKLRLVGRIDGFAPVTGEGSAALQIDTLKPDIVFVALGSPLQEQWMVETGSTLPVGLIQGIGGTLDVIAGKVRRAPPAFRKLGLEWMYRLLAEPWRWRRQLVLVRFVGHVLHQRIARASGPQRQGPLP